MIKLAEIAKLASLESKEKREPGIVGHLKRNKWKYIAGGTALAGLGAALAYKNHKFNRIQKSPDLFSVDHSEEYIKNHLEPAVKKFKSDILAYHIRMETMNHPDSFRIRSELAKTYGEGRGIPFLSVPRPPSHILWTAKYTNDWAKKNGIQSAHAYKLQNIEEHFERAAEASARNIVNDYVSKK